MYSKNINTEATLKEMFYPEYRNHVGIQYWTSYLYGSLVLSGVGKEVHPFDALIRLYFCTPIPRQAPQKLHRDDLQSA